MTPGLVVSNRRTKGSTDNGGIQVNLPWFKYERLAKFRKMGLVEPFPPLPMLQTFPVISIKTQLKILIMNICCRSKKNICCGSCAVISASAVESAEPRICPHQP
jgi:hypothetical protein